MDLNTFSEAKTIAFIASWHPPGLPFADQPSSESSNYFTLQDDRLLPPDMFGNILPHNATLMWRLELEIHLTDLRRLLFTQKLKYVPDRTRRNKLRPWIS